MDYKIIHSPLAKKSFQQNIIYLEENWTIREVQVFIKKTLDVVSILKVNPVIFAQWGYNKKIRKVVLLKQITMFYEVDGKEIDILLFWNNYQNPDKIKNLLSDM